MNVRALPRRLEPSAEVLAAECDAAELESAPYPPTMARAKLRRYIEAVGIADAVRITGIPRATLLALRHGTRDDPKVSQVVALEQHAGIELHDWVTLVPACRASSQK